MSRAPARAGGSDVLIEIVTLGAFAKVSAIDTVSGVEVSITGPANADRGSLEAAVMAKLDYVIKKQRTGSKDV
jgi:uncharacterized protein DUF6898